MLKGDVPKVNLFPITTWSSTGSWRSLVCLKWEESLLRCYSRESCCLYLFLGRWQICSWTKGSWLKFPCSLSIKQPSGFFSRALTDLHSSAEFSGTRLWISTRLHLSDLWPLAMINNPLMFVAVYCAWPTFMQWQKWPIMQFVFVWSVCEWLWGCPALLRPTRTDRYTPSLHICLAPLITGIYVLN